MRGATLPLFEAPTRAWRPPAGRLASRAEVRYVNARSLLTRATGFVSGYDFTLNPYSGCAFACEYCYARFFAPSGDQRDHWGEWVDVKANASALIARACRTGRLQTGDSIYMSSVTDPYQPLEHQLGLTRNILETLLEAGVQPRLTIQTRSPLAARDIDLFQRFEHIRVNFTIGTDTEAMRLRYEPHAPAIEARVRAAEAVITAGISVGISVSPMLPIRDPAAFGARLAALGARGYGTQYLKPARAPFAAGSTAEALGKMREDGWGLPEYHAARAAIAAALGPDRRLWEGARGYGPPR